MTFEAIGNEANKLAFGDYIKLCSDFGMNLKKETLTDIYRVRVKRGN